MGESEQLVLGIDVGTSGTKVVAVSADGKVVATRTAGYGMSVPAVGFAEQDPDDWWRATVEAVAGVMADVRLQGRAQVAAVGLSGQMHGLVPLDHAGRVIRPAIIWCDVRTVAQVDWLERTVGRERVIEWTQNPPLPNFTLTKLLWLRDCEPESYRRICHVLLPKDYVRYRMTGELAMDESDASGTLMFDVANRRWSEEMCHAAGTPREWLPPVLSSAAVAGKVTAAAAHQLGIPEGTPVVAGAGDQAAGAVGLAVAEPGLVSVLFGTSGVVLAPTAEPVRDPLGRLHTFCHAVPGLWFAMGVTQAAGGSLQWFRRRFGEQEELAARSRGLDVYEVLLDEAEAVEPGAEGLVFLPYLMGERTPHLDPAARGTWMGLQWRHERAHLVRALLEGVVFSLKDGWSVIAELGLRADRWRVSGGGAQGRLWMEIFASAVGAEVEVVRAAQGPAYGAAVLAAQGAGLLAPGPAGVEAWYEPGQTVAPNPDWQERYEKLYPLYRQAYQAARGVMHGLHAFQERRQPLAAGA
ncbi:MAG: xylulokinase [Alicyclobacillaceae bacterium]|nr:xylulokinase [Alicyclobacillaceae bacterium]